MMKYLSKNLLLNSLGLFVLLSGCTSTEKAPVEFNTIKRYDPYYEVKEGDTLESIASKFKMNAGELAKINSIRDKESIVPGRKLIVHVRPDEHVEEFNSVLVEKTDPVLEVEEPLELSLDSNEEKFKWPLDGKEISSFAQSKGVEIKAPKGTNVKSASSGIVKNAGNLAEYGKTVVVEYDNTDMKQKYTFVYSHLNEIKVKKGDTVDIGQVIGKVGKTGKVKTDRLFFQIRDSSMKPVNPHEVIEK